MGISLTSELLALILVESLISLSALGNPTTGEPLGSRTLHSKRMVPTNPQSTSLGAFYPINTVEVGHGPDAVCDLDRAQTPQLKDLASCESHTMRSFWRSRARLVGPSGWSGAPTAIYQTQNGSYHIGYQCQPNHVTGLNVSQCSAGTSNFACFNDYNSWNSSITIAPTQLYDIGGIIGGSVIRDGWNNNPTLIYTSIYPQNIEVPSQPLQTEGTETQNLAYTEDDGKTWIKFNYGELGNPVLHNWPERNLTDFRDPFVFECPFFSDFYSSSNSSIFDSVENKRPTGKKFLTLSGGILNDSDTIGAPRIFLYQQTEDKNFIDWTYRGTLLDLPSQFNASNPWEASYGTRFEYSGITRLGTKGKATGKEPDYEFDLIVTGTRSTVNETSKDAWPTWNAVNYTRNYDKGEIKAEIKYSGLLDWGRAYGFAIFHAEKDREVTVGWCPEDEKNNTLALQRGYGGAFTLFRDIFVKVIHNVNPSAPETQEEGGSWKVYSEPNGSTSVITLGQRIVPEITEIYKKNSVVSKPEDRTLDSGTLVEPNSLPTETDGDYITNLVPFEKQPKQSYYAIKAQLDFYGSRDWSDSPAVNRTEMVRGGFRILAGSEEWTDIYYDPPTESLIVDRSKSSVIESYGNSTETAKHRLWPIIEAATNTTRLEPLQLTIIVDNSVIEIYANDQTVLTTRAYPWIQSSTGVSFFVQAPRDGFESSKVVRTTPKDSLSHFVPRSVKFSEIELWEGLINAWPNRPNDTSLPLLDDNNITTTLYGIWPID